MATMSATYEAAVQAPRLFRSVERLRGALLWLTGFAGAVVFTGNLSLVGPRPHAVHAKAVDRLYDEAVDGYFARHRVKPGITGWAQINGSRGPVHTREEVRRRVVLDVEYIERQSLWLDLYILAMTLPCLLGDRQAIR